MALASEVLIRVRDLLNDVAATRWTDVQLLRLATDGQRIIVRAKNSADTQNTIVKTEPPALTNSGDTLRIRNQYFQTLSSYVVFQALMDDTDDGSANLAETHRAYFVEQIGAEFL